MKRLLIGVAALLAVPAQAAQVFPNSTGVAIDLFDFGTQGTRLAYKEREVTALTFRAVVRSAVYRNTNNTLDFYYQVQRLGIGNGEPDAGNDHQIHTLTGAQYGAFTTFAFRAGPTDVDGNDPTTSFSAPNNPGLFTSTAGRDEGNRVEIRFGSNGLVGTETSTTYIIRTSATRYKNGTFGLINGSAIGGSSFAPTVPEPATWAMMLGGFGLLGAAVRRSSRAKTVLA